MNRPEDEYPTCQHCGAELPEPIPGELPRCLNCNALVGLKRPSTNQPSSPSTPPEQAGTPASSEPIDAIPVDAFPVAESADDTASFRKPPIDEAPLDAQPVEAEPVDAQPVDAYPVDPETIGFDTARLPNPSSADGALEHPQQTPPQTPPQLPPSDATDLTGSRSSNPYAAPSVASSAPKAQVGLSLGFTAVAILLMIGLVAMAPMGIVPVLVLGVTALLRSQSLISRTHVDLNQSPTFGDQAIAFAKSLAVCIAISIASFIAFFVTCLSMIPIAMGMRSSGAETLGVIALLVVPTLVYFGLVAKTWPRKNVEI